jgi:hypothetical protein
VVAGTVPGPADDMRRHVARLIGALFAAIVLVARPGIAATAKIEPGGALALQEARTGCPPPPNGADVRPECEPLDFGELGNGAKRRFTYGTYRYADREPGSPLVYVSVVVFERVGTDRLRALVLVDGEAGVFRDKPRLLRSQGRLLLHISGSESGTGNFNRERLFVWHGAQWHQVDTTAWLEELRHRLRAGFGAWKGIYPDYAALRADTPLWRDGDGNACPTGGRARLRLGWRDDRVVLQAIQYRPAGECGDELPARPARR